MIGLILLTLSGIGCVILGTAFTPLFIARLALLVILWLLGLFIDNVIEHKFEKHAPVEDESMTSGFARIQKQHLAIKALTTLVFYVITIAGVLY